MVDYAFFVGLIKSALENNATINSACDGMIYTSSPGMVPVDDQLTGTNRACIGIQFGGLVPQALGGVSYHGISINNQLIFFVVTVENIQGRNSDTYASYIIGLIYDLIKGSISQTMNGLDYSIVFSNFKITSMFDPEFSNRANSKLQCEIKFLG
jgi:hypothetical protein